MASITLDTAWLNLASDLTQYVAIPVVTQINAQPQTLGETRRYGTRIRGVKSDGGTQRQESLAFDDCAPALVAQLREWDGQVLLYRDSTGEKFFGLFFSPQITWHQYDDRAAVSMTFSEITVSETV